MKLAILSDIHGNHVALKAVLKSVDAFKIKKLVILGDFVGYYYWPDKVLKLIQNYDVIAVAGNHEHILKKSIESSSYLNKVNKKYGSGIKLAIEKLTTVQINYLINLPDKKVFKTNEGEILLCHGSPWNNDEYIYPDKFDLYIKKYEKLKYKWILQGHTHYPMIKTLRNKKVINPGSVGQTRNREYGAHWSLLDTKKNEIVHYCKPYNTNYVMKVANKLDPSIHYLSKILGNQYT